MEPRLQYRLKAKKPPERSIGSAAQYYLLPHVPPMDVLNADVDCHFYLSQC